MSSIETDVVVVGAGNAALSAALASDEQGAKVLVLERAPEQEHGGNSRYTGGIVRFIYDGADDLLTLMPDLSEEERAQSDFGSYTAEQFFNDMDRMTQYRADPDLIPVLVNQSFDAMRWLQSKGVRFVPAFARQAYKINGRFRFWGGAPVSISGGGPGLIEALFREIARREIPVYYNSRAISLIHDEHGVHGVVVRQPGKTLTIRARAVVLACGGFEANAEWRTRYLGPGWDLAKVRGTRYNTGDGIQMALEAGAMPYGNWSGAHACAWDINAPDFGDLATGDTWQKHSYPLGIIVNANGERFVDEGADFRNYTYAKYGREILKQPGQFAWQIFDGKTIPLLRDEYRLRHVTRVRADTLEELAQKLEGVNPEGFLKTVEEFNQAVRTDVPFDPNILDGRGTEGLAIPKSNWANPIDTPPFEAHAATCGITFTFGGVRINTHGEVLDIEERPIPGLYAAGEMVGGLFYFNYPGGAGLTAGTVFGRIAGTSAAQRAQRSAD